MIIIIIIKKQMQKNDVFDLPRWALSGINTEVKNFFLLALYLLTSIHLLAIPVAVARVGVDADQGAAGVRLVARRNRQGGENWQGGAGGGVRRVNIAPRTFSLSRAGGRRGDEGNKANAGPPVMELRTSLEKDVSTELPWRVTEVTPPPMLRSSREPW